MSTTVDGRLQPTRLVYSFCFSRLLYHANHRLAWSNFSWGFKVIRDYFGFSLLCSVIDSENSCCPLNQSNAKVKTIATGCDSRFPALQAVRLFSLWVLIGWWWYSIVFWLVAVITLVSVFRHPVESCWITLLLKLHVLGFRKHWVSVDLLSSFLECESTGDYLTLALINILPKYFFVSLLLFTALVGMSWHLRKTNWIGEPTDLLDNEVRSPPYRSSVYKKLTLNFTQTQFIV